MKRLEFHALEVGDLLAELVPPGDERALGHVEFIGDAGQAPALDAQFNEPVMGFGVVHRDLWLVN